MNALFRFAVAHLRGSWQRTTAAACAIFVAVASFVILTGTVTTQQLQVTQTVANNYRSTYDILVRPRGTAGPLEQSAGLVRPNFLAGSYGGIRMEQVRQIATVPGVDVAAPVAVLGQTMRNILIPVDVRAVLKGKDRAMVRYSLNGSSRNGTASTSNQHGYVYLTKSPLTMLDPPADGPPDAVGASVEKRAGTTVTACLPSAPEDQAQSPAESFKEQCWSVDRGADGSQRLEILLSLPLTVEAIDPVAEAKLTGLGHAITDGRALTGRDAIAVSHAGPAPISTVTAIMADELPFDYQATIKVEELTAATTDQVLATPDAASRRRLVLAAEPAGTVATLSRDAAEAYRSNVLVEPPGEAAGPVDESLFISSFIQPSDVTYTKTNPLLPKGVPFDPKAWRLGEGTGGFVPMPTSATDTGYRSVTGQPRTDTSTLVAFNVIGTYDPDRLPRPSRLNQVPLETYRPPTLLGADAASRAALGDKPLRSDLNPTGYVQSPPAMLVSLKALPLLWRTFAGLNHKAPVSSVRVRVAGITGLGPVDREKIRQVAQTIEARTGLQVDVTIGASLQNREVDLPATPSGTPALTLNEQWTKKGVAVAISESLDVKSLVLSIVILISSALTVALTSAAAVASRRRELATLACIGWPHRRLGSLLATELALLGIGAGALAALASWPLARALEIDITGRQGALAVPLGAALALIPGLAATYDASKTAPIDALRPKVGRRERTTRLSLSGPVTLGLMMTNSRRGRAMVGALAVAVAVASALALVIIVSSFNGAVVGSFLGDAVALQVRGPDIAAAVVLAVLGLVAVATVLLLALAEDAPSFAVLRATGWTDLALSVALMAQATAIGLTGATIGAALALLGTALFIGPITIATLGLAALAIVTAVAAATAVSLVPAFLLSRLPTARILAHD